MTESKINKMIPAVMMAVGLSHFSINHAAAAVFFSTHFPNAPAYANRPEFAAVCQVRTYFTDGSFLDGSGALRDGWNRVMSSRRRDLFLQASEISA